MKTEKAVQILGSQLPRSITLQTMKSDFPEFLACVLKVGERHLHRTELYAPLDVMWIVCGSGRQLEANCSPVG
jgi:hypothetical protein